MSELGEIDPTKDLIYQGPCNTSYTIRSYTRLICAFIFLFFVFVSAFVASIVFFDQKFGVALAFISGGCSLVTAFTVLVCVACVKRDPSWRTVA